MLTPRLMVVILLTSVFGSGESSGDLRNSNNITCPKHKICLNLCCPEGQLLAEEGNFCTPPDEEQEMVNVKEIIFKNGVIVDGKEEDFYILYHNPCRDKENSTFEYEHGEYHILKNGSLSEGRAIFNNFCIFSDGGEGNATHAIFCDEEKAENDKPDTLNRTKTITGIAWYFYIAGIFISLPFFLATFVVYAVLRPLQDITGKCVLGLTASFFCTFFFILMTAFFIGMPESHCRSIAFVIYFSFLASFFWLNVMCLDIWWTFSGFRPLQGSVKEREHKKFIIYSLYCWGSPLIMLIIAMTMDLHPDIPDSYLKPRFGKYKCWFETEEATLWYFLGPIAVLILSNIILFIATAIKIRKLKNETKILEMKGSKRHEVDESNAQRFNLYLKLFLVMGVNWIMEVISWACGGPEYLWYVTDIGNTLQGVLIFIIFVWKDRIRRLLMERFCPKRSMSSSTRSALTTTRSITSTGPNTRNSTLTNKASVRSTNLEEYRMKPLMENSCMESEVP